MHLFGGQRAGFRGHRAAQFLTVSLEFCLFGMFKCCCLVDVCDLHIFFVPKILGTVKLYHKIVALLLIQVIMAFLVCHTSWKLSCTSFQSFLTKILRFSLKLCTGAMCLCDASQNENFKPTQIIIACKYHATSLAVVERKIVIQSYPLDLQACRLLRKLNKLHLRPFCFRPHPVDTVPPPTFGDKVYLEHKSIRISSHLLGYMHVKEKKSVQPPLLLPFGHPTNHLYILWLRGQSLKCHKQKKAMFHLSRLIEIKPRGCSHIYNHSPSNL